MAVAPRRLPVGGTIRPLLAAVVLLLTLPQRVSTTMEVSADKLVFPVQEKAITYVSEDHRLEGHVLLIVHADLITQCARRCHLHPGCESVNFYQADKRCELNDVTDANVPVTPYPGARYVTRDTYVIDNEALGVCTPNPCLNDGWCMNITTRDGAAKALCICKDGWTGVYCADVVGTLAWSEWESWGECSATCGQAWRQRQRTCTNTKTGQTRPALDCFGRELEVEACIQPDCPAWLPWSDWSECSTLTTCGEGTMSRHRQCSNSGTPGVDRRCMGPTNETAICNMPSCNEPIQVAGGGSQGRVEIYDREGHVFRPLCADNWTLEDANVACKQLGFSSGTSGETVVLPSPGQTPQWNYLLSGLSCTGGEESLQSCLHNPWKEAITCATGAAAALRCIVNGAWGDWSSWGDCSVTCATGQRMRNRECNSPAASEGGADCGTNSTEYKTCILDPCPVDGSRWRKWSGWSQCSASCNGGLRGRTRVCDGVDVSCDGATSEAELCRMVSCLAVAEWTQWAYWSTCDVTCDGGLRKRERACLELDGIQVPCAGHESEVELCAESICPGSPWRPWSDWSHCSTSCGGGWSSRKRHLVVCGDNCEESADMQSVTCNAHPCPVDGAWGDWSDWAECNVTCGGGGTSRNRQCIAPLHGGEDCPGPAVENKDCNTHECPVDGVWIEWSEWAVCNETCGGGWRSRSRTCDGPFYGGQECVGPEGETEQCNTHPCAVDAYWKPWTEWAACNVSCGGGISYRTRECVEALHGGEMCTGDPEEVKDCNTHPCPIDCVWHEWSEWEMCNVTCNEGSQRRNRSKSEEKYGGTPCEGDIEEFQSCNLRACPVDGFWEPWMHWSSCDKSCGEGTRVRERECFAGLHGGSNCTGDKQEVEDCFLIECPVDGVWHEWSEWTVCSVTCANGTHSRNRTCEGPFHNGAPCEGPAEEVQECFPRPCPVHGVWEDWSEWTRCTTVCGGGTQERQRECIGPFHEGDECAGDSMEEQPCNTMDCPENGYWEMWTEWGACSTSCGTGIQNRTRLCIPPKHGGKNCTGEWQQEQPCNTHPCPVDGFWMSWESWGSCNVSCGGGQQVRQRQCESPKYDGEPCEGEPQDWQACNEHHCPVDGFWTSWETWGSCNESCGGGHQVRLRQCETPKHGGKSCEGDSEDWQGCNAHPCPEDAYWHGWEEWLPCNVSCGGGWQVRRRQCEAARNGGRNCVGPDDDYRGCNDQPCPVDCVWEEWATWQTCNATCGEGHRVRSRGQNLEQHGGVPCEGQSQDWEPCNLGSCPVDCVWEEWAAWETCNVTCGLGQQKRHRGQQVELYGGRPCEGGDTDWQECSPRPCPVDGVWEEWSDWTVCPVTCGGSHRYRNRTCDPPLHGGKDCQGPWQEAEECSSNPCPIPGDWLAWETWSACSVTCAGGTRTRRRHCDMESYGNLTADCTGNSTETGDCHTFPCQPAAVTCDEWVSMGLVDSAIVDVHPDPLQPSFRVRCEVDFANQTGTAVIGHDRPDRYKVQGFEGAGEYEADLTYLDADGEPISLAMVIKYVDKSSSCQQYISWECNAAGIHHPNDISVQTTFWTNRWNVAMTYWGGAQPGTNKCACGMTQTCSDVNKICNCDMNDQVWRQDDGFLTYKDDLPIHSFRAGDTGREGYETGYFIIGELVCWGPVPPAALTTPSN